MLRWTYKKRTCTRSCLLCSGDGNRHRYWTIARVFIFRDTRLTVTEIKYLRSMSTKTCSIFGHWPSVCCVPRLARPSLSQIDVRQRDEGNLSCPSSRLSTLQPALPPACWIPKFRQFPTKCVAATEPPTHHQTT